MPDDQGKKPNGTWSAMGVGTQMVAATFVGAGIGWWLDKKTSQSPLFLVIFFFLGSAAGFISVYRAFRGGGGRP
jgi:ATP synthase protein I